MNNDNKRTHEKRIFDGAKVAFKIGAAKVRKRVQM